MPIHKAEGATELEVPEAKFAIVYEAEGTLVLVSTGDHGATGTSVQVPKVDGVGMSLTRGKGTSSQVPSSPRW